VSANSAAVARRVSGSAGETPNNTAATPGPTSMAPPRPITSATPTITMTSPITMRTTCPLASPYWRLKTGG